VLGSSRIVAQSNLGPEGFGLSVAEASAMGVPVVAFDVPALNEIVIHGETGFLARPRDPESLAECLKILLENDELALSFGAAGRKAIGRRFTPEGHLQATFSAYEHCMEMKELGMAV
jgi:glycosyltransferase involved in cell wall biosynthesis